jgi:hypothetical protein
MHNETLSVAMCVHNSDRSPVQIDAGNAAPAEIVSDNFPIHFVVAV